MSTEKILIIEDDHNISKLVRYNLEKAGYKTSASETGEEAMTRLQTQRFDLIILDIMLPGMDGFEICRLIKQEKKLSAIPIIMLTARGEEVDRIVGLELGADDYMVKPFSPRELVLRVKAVLKRSVSRDESKDIVQIGNLCVDIPRHKVLVNNKEVILTSMEFSLLLTLMERQGRVQSRDRLLNDVWDMEADIITRTVDTHIKHLRQKLGKAGKMIETVRGLGYRFKEE